MPVRSGFDEEFRHRSQAAKGDLADGSLLRIAPHIPVWERYQRTDGMFPRTDFAYDAERDVYICLNDRILRTSGTVHDGRVRNYLSQPGDCRACELKAQCTRAPFRKIARDINEEARDYARSLKGTPEFEQSSDERKKVEMRFTHLKVQHRFKRMRLRGLTGARDEFILAAIAQNLKTLANQNLAAADKPAGGVPRLTALVVLAINRENDLVAPPTGAAINRIRSGIIGGLIRHGA